MRPSSQARVACERVLKNRAAQSHLSTLTADITLFSYDYFLVRMPAIDRAGALKYI